MGNDSIISKFLTQVRESYNPVGDLINRICERYLHVMNCCIQYEGVKEIFEKYPRPFLVDFVGMKIPEDAIIVLDPNGTRWPVARFLNDSGEVEYIEGALSVVENNYLETGKIKSNTVIRDEKSLVVKNIPMKRNQCKKMIITMPYFTSETDLLTEYKFEGAGEPEIVLSSC